MPAVLSEISHPSTTAENSALEAQSSAEKKPVSQPEEKVGVQSNSDEKITKIYGPPGTGKTTTLINLVKRFVAEGVAPQEIGYFAFTNFATRVAKERIQQTFPELNLENDPVSNNCSLAYRSLQNLRYPEEQAKEFDPSFTFKHEMMEWMMRLLCLSGQNMWLLMPQASQGIILFPLRSISDAPISTTMRLNKWLGYGYNTANGQFMSQTFQNSKSTSRNMRPSTDKNVIDYTSILENAASTQTGFQTIKLCSLTKLRTSEWSVVNNLITKSQAAFIAGDDKRL